MPAADLGTLAQFPEGSIQAIHETIVDSETTAFDELKSKPLVESVSASIAGKRINEYSCHGRVSETTGKR